MQTDVTGIDVPSEHPICEQVRTIYDVLTGVQYYIWTVKFHCQGTYLTPEHEHNFLSQTKIHLN